jgi:peptidoglycan/LPS O-acetylase OafA/YrhL
MEGLPPEIQTLLEVIFAGAVGKFLIDTLRKGASKIGLSLNKWLIRGTAFLVAYLVLLIYSLVVGQPLHTGLLEAVVPVITAAMLSIATNELLPKDKTAITATPPTPK